MSSTLETGNRHTLSEMCLTPVLINHPAVSAVIVIEGCGEGET